MVSLKTIATSLGVSVNTVSRSLNDASDISTSMKEKVEKMANELGYIPNERASNLRKGISKTVGVVFDNLFNPYFNIVINYLHQSFSKHNINILFFKLNRSYFDRSALNETLSKGLLGIVSFLIPDSETADFILKNEIPYIVFGRDASNLGIDSILTDDAEGGYLAGKYLTNKNYSKIGYLGIDSKISVNQLRLDGFLKALKEKNIVLGDEYIQNNLLNSVDECLENLMNLKVEAIVCFNDHIALEVLSLLKQKYPKQNITIVGFDNISKYIKFPGLFSSIDSDKEEMAEIATNILLKRFSDKKFGLVHEVFPMFLAVRE
jgi:LacI family transcriptional regulator